MKRVVYFLMLLFVLTGCSYKYDVEIDKKKNVSENLDVFESNSVFISKGTNADLFIDTNVSIYNNDADYSNYDISKVISKVTSGVSVKSSFKSFEDYTKGTKVKKSLFGRIELYEEGNFGFFKANDYRGELFFTDEESDFQNESVEFNLKIPFEVVSNNADNVDEKKGVYTWHFNKNSIDKEVNVKFNLKKIVVKENIFVKYIYLFLIPVFLLLFALFIFIRYKYVNRF